MWRRGPCARSLARCRRRSRPRARCATAHNRWRRCRTCPSGPPRCGAPRCRRTLPWKEWPRSCRDRLLEDEVIAVVAEPFEHFGIARLAGEEAAWAGDQTEKIALLGEIEGDRDRLALIGGAHDRGRTAIAGHGVDPHRQFPSTNSDLTAAEFKCFETNFNLNRDIYYINPRFLPDILVNYSKLVNNVGRAILDCRARQTPRTSWQV